MSGIIKQLGVDGLLSDVQRMDKRQVRLKYTYAFVVVTCAKIE